MVGLSEGLGRLTLKEARLKSRLEWASRKSKRERLTLTLVLRKLERKKLRKREVVKVEIGAELRKLEKG